MRNNGKFATDVKNIDPETLVDIRHLSIDESLSRKVRSFCRAGRESKLF